MGNYAVKYSAKPRSSKSDPIPRSPSFNYLEEAMAKQLANKDVYFDFLIQVQTDPVTMPVEDATILWDERLSPFEKVATIRIPSQVFNTPERLKFNDFHLANDKDPLLGNHEMTVDGQGKGPMVIEAAKAKDGETQKPPFFCSNLTRFVETRGGDYFFIPSMTALPMIAEGIVDPT